MCPLRIFITGTQNLAMLQNLTCIAFGGVSINGIFVIFCVFQEGTKECFVLAGNTFSSHGYTVLYKYCALIKY